MYSCGFRGEKLLIACLSAVGGRPQFVSFDWSAIHRLCINAHIATNDTPRIHMIFHIDFCRFQSVKNNLYALSTPPTITTTNLNI